MRLPAAALLDTSVLLRLFHDHGDRQQRAAEAIRRALETGRIELVLLDLGVYEFVNVLVHGLGKDAGEADACVEALFDLDLPLAVVDRDRARAVADLAARSGLSGHDAAFVVAAEDLAIPLITADEGLARRASGRYVITLAALASS